MAFFLQTNDMIQVLKKLAVFCYRKHHFWRLKTLNIGPKTTVLLYQKNVAEWRTKGQNQNKNQREGNTPPPPIAILLVLRKPKNQF
jgi:hypothetical protein